MQHRHLGASKARTEQSLHPWSAFGVLPLFAPPRRSSIGRLPEGGTWMQMWGIAAVAGMGFTMNLFIGTLAFPDGGNAADIRIGVVVGSLTSALAGYLILRWSSRAGDAQSDPARSAP